LQGLTTFRVKNIYIVSAYQVIVSTYMGSDKISDHIDSESPPNGSKNETICEVPAHEAD